ncbi:MAG: tetratricopeptide repeat protein [Vicinamibacterales bacterium]|nr:tetratricopeptide repeat protein [Vicinamibacterales bacterium]
MEIIGLSYRWGVILQVAAILHFVQRRPDNFWLWVILMGGGLGSLVYIFVEVLPDAGLVKLSFEGMSRRRRARDLEAIVHDNPAIGNLEELADLYLEEKQFSKARQLYDKVIASRTDSIDPFYRRGLAAIAMEDFPSALPDLEKVVAKDPKYDFYRAIGALALVHGKAGDAQRAETLFNQALEISTQSETYYNYASFLAGVGRSREAREWAERILAKKPTMPRYLRRRERPWFRKATSLIKQLPAT